MYVDRGAFVMPKIGVNASAPVNGWIRFAVPQHTTRTGVDRRYLVRAACQVCDVALRSWARWQ